MLTYQTADLKIATALSDFYLLDTSLMLGYIRKRMEELGYGNAYRLRIRHFVLSPLETRVIEGSDHLFLLMDLHPAIVVDSAFGFFDLSAGSANELQYEHQGTITLTNKVDAPVAVRFVQAIPDGSEI